LVRFEHIDGAWFAVTEDHREGVREPKEKGTLKYRKRKAALARIRAAASDRHEAVRKERIEKYKAILEKVTAAK
jgi:hypothetical protein